MTRVLVAVGAALALCFLVLGLVVYLTREEDRVAVDAVLAERLTRAVNTAAEQGEPLDLAEVAPFQWDRVLIFPRRTPRAAISERLGSEFRGDLLYDVESAAVLVFARGSELARFADYRGVRPFEGLPVVLPRDRAVLDVDPEAVRAR